MKIMLDKGVILPTRAHPWDAGLDLYATNKVSIPGCRYRASTTSYSKGEVLIGTKTIDTGVQWRSQRDMWDSSSRRVGLWSIT